MLPVQTDHLSAPTREMALMALTGCLREAADGLPEDIAAMTLAELEAKRTPSEADVYLRLNLWKQVKLVQSGAIKEIEPIDIYRGVCSAQNYARMATNPLRVAWLLIPPSEDHDRMAAGFKLGLTNLLEFISRKVNDDSAMAFLKAMEFLANRVHGPVVQKIDTRNLNVNVTKKEVPNQKDLHARLEELKSEILNSKDVTPIDKPNGN